MLGPITGSEEEQEKRIHMVLSPVKFMQLNTETALDGSPPENCIWVICNRVTQGSSPTWPENASLEGSG